jgi:hypothetical protein
MLPTSIAKKLPINLTMAHSTQTTRFLGVYLGDKVVPNQSAVQKLPSAKKKKRSGIPKITQI